MRLCASAAHDGRAHSKGSTMRTSPSTPASFSLERVARQQQMTSTQRHNVVVWEGRATVVVDVAHVRNDVDAHAWLCDVELAASRPDTRRVIVVVPDEGIGTLLMLERMQAGARLRSAFQDVEEVLFVVDSDTASLQAKLLVSFCRLPHTEVCPLTEFGEVASILLSDADLDVTLPAPLCEASPAS